MPALKRGDKIYCVSDTSSTKSGETYNFLKYDSGKSTPIHPWIHFKQDGMTKVDRALFFKRYTNHIPGIVKPFDKLAIEAQIANEKNIALEIMNKLGEGACVCGGAPRNWEFGRLANDLDIYISSDVQIGGTVFRANLLAENLGISAYNHIDCYGEDGIEEINSVYEFRYRGKPIQLISFNCYGEDLLKSVLKSFDFGICKIGMDSSGKILRAPEFNSDVENKTLTIDIDTIAEFPEATRKRVKKMQDYFPDHKISLGNS